MHLYMTLSIVLGRNRQLLALPTPVPSPSVYQRLVGNAAEPIFSNVYAMLTMRFVLRVLTKSYHIAKVLPSASHARPMNSNVCKRVARATDAEHAIRA